MSIEDIFLPDGRRLFELRVVDLKGECEKRALSKGGTKSQLQERLYKNLVDNNQAFKMPPTGDGASNFAVPSVPQLQQTHAGQGDQVTVPAEQPLPAAPVTNPLIQAYLAQQKRDVGFIVSGYTEQPTAVSGGQRMPDEAVEGNTADVTVQPEPVSAGTIQLSMGDGAVAVNNKEIAESKQEEVPTAPKEETIDDDAKKSGVTDTTVPEVVTRNDDESASAESKQTTRDISDVGKCDLNVERDSQCLGGAPIPLDAGSRQKDDAEESTNELDGNDDDGDGGGSKEQKKEVAVPVVAPDDVTDDVSAKEEQAAATVPSQPVEDETPLELNEDILDVDSDEKKSEDDELSNDVPPTTNESDTKQDKQPVVKKRRWGKTNTGKSSTLAISSDSLKEIVGEVNANVLTETDEIKHVEVMPPVAEPNLDVDLNGGHGELLFDGEDEEELGGTEPEEATVTTSSKRIVIAKDDDEDLLRNQVGENGKSSPKLRKPTLVGQATEIPRRKLLDESSDTDPSDRRRRTPSPPRRPASEIIYLRGLTRPFTVKALRLLLEEHGKIDPEGFWIDSIKANCMAKFQTKEEALSCRNKLHRLRWPTINPRLLRCDFSTQKEFDDKIGVVVPKPMIKEEIRIRHRAEQEELRIRVSNDRAKENVDKKDIGSSENRTAAKRERVSYDDESTEKSERKPRTSDRTVTEERKPRVERESDRTARHSKSPEVKRSRDRDAPRERDQLPSRHRPTRDGRPRERQEVRPREPTPAAKTLDDLFKKTKAMPAIYWLPLSEKDVEEKILARAQRRIDRLKRAGEFQDEIEEYVEQKPPLTKERRERPSPSPPRRKAVSRSPKRKRQKSPSSSPEIKQQVDPAGASRRTPERFRRRR